MPQPMPFPADDAARPAHHRPSPRPHRRAADPTGPTDPVDGGWGGGWSSLSEPPAERTAAHDRSPERGTAVDTGPTPRTSRRHEPRSAEEDSTGRGLAMRLPEWDLLPPTEFVQRRRGR